MLSCDQIEGLSSLFQQGEVKNTKSVQKKNFEAKVTGSRQDSENERKYKEFQKRV